MSMRDDIYSCTNPELPILSVPRAIQFYSSINYQGRVLLGEWPTGRLYEFDGVELKPSNMTPPEIAKLSDKRLGYEAQTMAEYCGICLSGTGRRAKSGATTTLQGSGNSSRDFSAM